MLTKILKIVAGLLLLIAIVLGFLYEHQRLTATKAVGKAKEAVETSQKLSQELTEAHLSHRVDLDAIAEVQKQKDDITQQAIKVKEKVDAVAEQVASHQISDSAADKFYLDSMWETYCEGADDPTCSARKSNK